MCSGRSDGSASRSWWCSAGSSRRDHRPDVAGRPVPGDARCGLAVGPGRHRRGPDRCRLSLGTEWGFVRHWWVVAKIVISFVVIATDVVVISGGVERGEHRHRSSPLRDGTIAHCIVLAGRDRAVDLEAQGPYPARPLAVRCAGRSYRRQPMTAPRPPASRARHRARRDSTSCSRASCSSPRSGSPCSRRRTSPSGAASTRSPSSCSPPVPWRWSGDGASPLPVYG